MLLLALALIGFVWYMLVTYVPMPAPMRTVITVLAVIFLIIIVLQAFGLISGSGFPGGTIRLR